MCELVTPMIRSGGVDVMYVMPNLQPPLTEVAQARRYHDTLTRLAPGVRFLMSLFLTSNMTTETIEEAKRSGIVYGVSHCFPSFTLSFFTHLHWMGILLTELGEIISSWGTTHFSSSQLLSRTEIVTLKLS